ncbi:MAG: amidase [Burkholderiaceae bacterium]|nr:amidase [Burkholderiaceae bacterium]
MASKLINRRGFVSALPAGLALGASMTPLAAAAAKLPLLGRDWSQADLETLRQAMDAGTLTSLALTRYYLHRIDKLDRRGPRLRAVIELNPDAREQARALDRERTQGKLRGPLHGMPVLLKDNIATGDRMSTTAGSLALAGLHATRDAFLVQRLREAGAVILGKTNLSEWANIRSTRSTSGWSSRGGLTLNPYALNRNTSGSSSGSGAAVAAGLCAVAVGTETDGSITSPASMCGLVGLKPTVGRISRDGVIPIAATQDTAGPMTRQVRDAAALLQVLAVADPRDAACAGAPAAPDYVAALRVDALRGARIGVIRTAMPPQPQVNALFEQALEVLHAQGAVLVDALDIPEQARYAEAETTAMMVELKDGLPRYLAEFQPDAPIKNLRDLIAWNSAHAPEVMPYFGQELFETSEASKGLDNEEYKKALDTNRRYARTEGLDALFAAHQLDAVVAPTGNLPWLNDYLLGDHITAGGFMSPFAVAGYPHLTVPMGLVSGLPAGLSFGALAWQEARLLSYGYAYEQASHKRVPPRLG